MNMSTQIKKKYKPIPINQLSIWESGNVRKNEVFVDIEDLAKNIREIGLQVPLVVWEKIPNKEYWLISGQRRLEACRMINYSPIECIIVEKPSVQNGMIMSLSENLYRQPMTADDISDACDFLYNRFRSIEKVANHLGVSTATVRKYLGYRKVPDEIKELVREKRITPSQALLIYTQFPDLKKQIRMAKEMAKIKDRVEKSKFSQAIKESSPNDDIDKIKTRTKELKEGKNYKIFLRSKTSNTIEKSANEMEVEPEFVIVEVVEDWTEKRLSKSIIPLAR